MPKKEPLYPHVPKGQPVGLETEKDILRRYLIGWIDRRVIADAIIDAMAEEEVDLTPNNARTVWLDVLENIHELIENAIKYKLRGG